MGRRQKGVMVGEVDREGVMVREVDREGVMGCGDGKD